MMRTKRKRKTERTRTETRKITIRDGTPLRLKNQMIPTSFSALKHADFFPFVHSWMRFSDQWKIIQGKWMDQTQLTLAFWSNCPIRGHIFHSITNSFFKKIAFIFEGSSQGSIVSWLCFWWEFSEKHSVFKMLAFHVTTAAQELSRCDPLQWKEMYGTAQSLFTWDKTTEHL